MNEPTYFYLIIFFFFFMSVVLHEVAHGGVAYLLGDPTAHSQGRLTLNPFAHVDFLNSLLLPIISYLAFGIFFGGAKPIPVQREKFRIKNKDLGDFLVTLAGPLTNLILAFLLALALRWTPPESIWAKMIVLSLAIQLLLFAFNMVPLPPLDGSHILRLLLPKKMRKFFEDVLFPLGLPLLLALIIGLTYFGYGGRIATYLDKGVVQVCQWVGSGHALEQVWEAEDYERMRRRIFF